MNKIWKHYGQFTPCNTAIHMPCLELHDNDFNTFHEVCLNRRTIEIWIGNYCLDILIYAGECTCGKIYFGLGDVKIHRERVTNDSISIRNPFNDGTVYITSGIYAVTTSEVVNNIIHELRNSMIPIRVKTDVDYLMHTRPEWYDFANDLEEMIIDKVNNYE